MEDILSSILEVLLENWRSGGIGIWLYRERTGA